MLKQPLSLQRKKKRVVHPKQQLVPSTKMQPFNKHPSPRPFIQNTNTVASTTHTRKPWVRPSIYNPRKGRKPWIPRYERILNPNWKIKFKKRKRLLRRQKRAHYRRDSRPKFQAQIIKLSPKRRLLKFFYKRRRHVLRTVKKKGLRFQYLQVRKKLSSRQISKKSILQLLRQLPLQYLDNYYKVVSQVKKKASTNIKNSRSLLSQIAAFNVKSANKLFFSKNETTRRLLGKPLYKQRLNLMDKLFQYYRYQLSFSFFTYKVLIYLEMLLSSVLLHTHLVKYTYQVSSLCFNNLVSVNGLIINNRNFLVSLYDNIKILSKITFYFYYQQYQQNFFARPLIFFFRKYWRRFYVYRLNKIWLLQNLIKNQVPECFIFEYPNLLLYISPLRRLTALFFNIALRDDAAIYQPDKVWRLFNIQKALLKTKLFEYALFYR